MKCITVHLHFGQQVLLLVMYPPHHIALVTGPSPRKLLHRVLICACALLCLPIILELARCLSSEVKPQPLPRAEVIYEVPYAAQQTISAPQPPPRCPVPQKCKTPPPKGISCVFPFVNLLWGNTQNGNFYHAVFSSFFCFFAVPPKVKRKPEVSERTVSIQSLNIGNSLTGLHLLNCAPPPLLFTMLQVMYAVISEGALKQQGATRQPAHSATVYSSLRFDNH